MHKRYSVFVGMNEKGQAGGQIRVDHDRESMRAFLKGLPNESPVAIETVGNWYWLVDEVEAAGHQPMLTNAKRAKLLMGLAHKSDRLDAKGLATLARNGTLPRVWIPPAELRDTRELLRLRMRLVRTRTQYKNRIHATLEKYLIQIEVSDLFGKKGRRMLMRRLKGLPEQHRESVRRELKLLDHLGTQIDEVEERILELVKGTPEMQLLRTLPGVAVILSSVIALEVGDITRFGRPEHLASYSGTVPRLNATGGKIRHGKVRKDVNRYLKWAFVEAANAIVLKQRSRPDSHVVRLYQRVKSRKGYPKAVVAVARHLAEATFWMLTRQEPYKEPSKSKLSSTAR
jgi:transposase